MTTMTLLQSYSQALEHQFPSAGALRTYANLQHLKSSQNSNSRIHADTTVISSTVWNMRRGAPDQEVDQEVDQRGHGKRLCKKIAKRVI